MPHQEPPPGEPFEVIDDTPATPPDETDVPTAAHLDTQRIRQLSALRRSLYRSRTHALLAAGVLLVGSVELAWWAMRQWHRSGLSAGALACAAAALGLLAAGWRFLKTARRHHAEAARRGNDQAGDR